MERRAISLFRSGRRVPADSKILLREIRRQATFNVREVRGAGHTRLRILLPPARIIKRKIDVMFGELAGEIRVRVHKLHRIRGWRIWRHFYFRNLRLRLSDIWSR